MIATTRMKKKLSKKENTAIEEEVIKLLSEWIGFDKDEALDYVTEEKKNRKNISEWVKNIDIMKELEFHEFSLHNQFILVANIIQTPNSVSRQTVITFEPVISEKDWNERSQWIYILTIDNRIVKIGGTRTGLKERTVSYLCGHHTIDRGGSGKCSVTNAYLYNTLDYYIKNGHDVKMYGSRIPSTPVHVDIWGEKVVVEAQIYNAFESRAINIYHTETGHNPQLSNNSDPNHR